jgi:hypothetical protein
MGRVTPIRRASTAARGDWSRTRTRVDWTRVALTVGVVLFVAASWVGVVLGLRALFTWGLWE